jgi:NADH-quinone oxidoreductase subunit I
MEQQAQKTAAKSYFDDVKTTVNSIWNGMSITLSYMFRRPTTVQYPDRVEVPVRDTLPDRYRGFLEVDMDICTACQACERDCPIDVIHIGIEGKGKNRVMTQFDIDIAKCMFCGLCTEHCPTGAIQHTPEFEASAISMNNLTMRFVPDPVAGIAPYKPEKGVEAFPRKPLGSITRKLIKAWDAPDPEFPGEAGEEQVEEVATGPSELAKKAVGLTDAAAYALVLEEAMAGTDCYACGYPTCRDYSEAIASGKETKLNLCEPGGKDSEREVLQIVGAKETGFLPPGPIESEPVVGKVVEAIKKLQEGGGAETPPAEKPSEAS